MTAARPLVFDPCNEIHLIGRVCREPEVLVLPSGDELVKAKITVPRPPPTAGRDRRVASDHVVCAAWEQSLRRRVRVWCKGDVVEVKGALRSRVRRRGDGVHVLYEVELAEVAAFQPRSVRSAGGDADLTGVLEQLFPPESDGADEINASSA